MKLNTHKRTGKNRILHAISKLPNQSYWSDDLMWEYLDFDHILHRLNLTRHLFVNKVPLFFVLIECEEFEVDSIRQPFCTLGEGTALVERMDMEGHTISSVQFLPISDLNKLHRSLDTDGTQVTHDFTNWVAYGLGKYQTIARKVYEGLSKEHQEQLLPAESRHLLVGKSPVLN